MGHIYSVCKNHALCSSFHLRVNGGLTAQSSDEYLEGLPNFNKCPCMYPQSKVWHVIVSSITTLVPKQLLGGE